MINRLRSVDRHWFFKELPAPVKILTLIFIRGDLIILLPLIILIALLYLFSVEFGLIMTGLYITVRSLGEMIYWFSHQFNSRTYRPYDLGFKNLDNNAVYILYQTISIAGMMLGAGIIAATLLFINR